MSILYHTNVMFIALPISTPEFGNFTNVSHTTPGKIHR